MAKRDGPHRTLDIPGACDNTVTTNVLSTRSRSSNVPDGMCDSAAVGNDGQGTRKVELDSAAKAAAEGTAQAGADRARAAGLNARPEGSALMPAWVRQSCGPPRSPPS